MDKKLILIPLYCLHKRTKLHDAFVKSMRLIHFNFKHDMKTNDFFKQI